MIFTCDKIKYKCCAHIQEEDCEKYHRRECDDREGFCAFLEIEDREERKFLMHCFFCNRATLHRVIGLSLDSRCCECGNHKLLKSSDLFG